jgi:hypothetical protein
MLNTLIRDGLTMPKAVARDLAGRWSLPSPFRAGNLLGNGLPFDTGWAMVMLAGVCLLLLMR